MANRRSDAEQRYETQKAAWRRVNRTRPPLQLRFPDRQALRDLERFASQRGETVSRFVRLAVADRMAEVLEDD